MYPSVIWTFVVIGLSVGCGSMKPPSAKFSHERKIDFSCPDAAIGDVVNPIFGSVSLPYRPLCHHTFELAAGQQMQLEVNLWSAVSGLIIDKQAFIDAGFNVEIGAVFEPSTTKQAIRFRRHDIVGDLSRDNYIVTLRLQRTSADGLPLAWHSLDALVGQVRPVVGATCSSTRMAKGKCICEYGWPGKVIEKHCEFRIFSDDARFPPDRQLFP